MLRETGIVRRTDALGRLVIPKEIRDTFGIPEGTPMEMFVGDNGEIIFRKYIPGCTFCGNIDGVKVFRGKKVCQYCADIINLSEGE